ncbi:hypothetical protein [Psychrobacillus phage Perkons]|nr:hypothetical protein [Psychrobacillus phage Perkons]
MSEYSLEKQQNESNFEYKVRLCVAKLNKEHDLDWSELINLLNLECSQDHLRKLSYGYKEMIEDEEFKRMNLPELDIKYKEATEILNDGSHKSDKLISMSTEQSKDINYLLHAHGFDTDEWEVVNAKNNIWNVNSIVQGVQTLYSSKITVKPKVVGFNVDKLIEVIKQEVKPITVDSPTQSNSKLLEIPLFDMHFGIADINYYTNTYERIDKKIKSQKWDTILFVIGQDLFHNDGFTGKTTAGTIIDKVNIEKAWKDADTFFTSLIHYSLLNSKNVDVVFSNGNHDQALGFAFVKMLEAKFPQVKFDTEMKQRKGFVWNDLFLGFTHGDKGSARISKNFLSVFGKQIATAKVVEIHSGHIHHEVTKDDFGIVIRSLSTGAKTDGWHDDNGFIGAMKRFQIFEYSSDTLDGIYYV